MGVSKAIVGCVFFVSALSLQFSGSERNRQEQQGFDEPSATNEFKGVRCQSAIARERDRFLDKWVANLHSHDDEAHPQTGVFISSKFNFAYVANQKVGSTSFKYAFNR